MTKEEKLKLGLHESLSEIKGIMSTMTFSPTGRAKNYTYFELKDFLPTATKLLSEFGIDDNFEITGETAMVTFKKKNEIKITRIPYITTPTPTAFKKDKQGNKIPGSEYETMSPIQHYGSLITYHKRYTYQNAFNISEGDIVENHVRYERAVRDIQVTISNYDLDKVKVFKYFKIGASPKAETLESAVEEIKKMNKQKLSDLKPGENPVIKEPVPREEPVKEEPVEEVPQSEVEVIADVMNDLPFEMSDDPTDTPKEKTLSPKQKLFKELDEVIASKGFDRTALYNHYQITDKTTMKDLQAIIIGVKALQGRK